MKRPRKRATQTGECPVCGLRKTVKLDSNGILALAPHGYFRRDELPGHACSGSGAKGEALVERAVPPGYLTDTTAWFYYPDAPKVACGVCGRLEGSEACAC